MRISVIINCDTRACQEAAAGMFNGARSVDFLKEGLENKWAFFKGFDIERIVFVDVHGPIPADIMDYLVANTDRLILSKHSKQYRNFEHFSAFNDLNYVQAFACARGDLIAHFDQDVAAFTSGQKAVQELVDLVSLDIYKFVSLPAVHSPDPVEDESFQGRWWASTQFFLTKTETIDITALEHAVRDPNWAYATFGEPPRKAPWTEHFLTLLTGHSVFYPPINLDKLAIFSWSNYRDGALGRLNALSFEEVSSRLAYAGGVFYNGVDSTKLIHV